MSARGPHHGMPPAQVERLALLANQCGECASVLGRILIHGPDALRGDLAHAMAGINTAMALVTHAGDVDRVEIAKAEQITFAALEYLHHQKTRRRAPKGSDA